MGTLLCYLFYTWAQLVCLRRVTGVRLRAGGLFLRPCACGLVCAGAAWALRQAVPGALGTGCAMLLAAWVYGVGMLLLGAVPKEDWLMLPQGQKIAKMLEKRGWI